MLLAASGTVIPPLHSRLVPEKWCKLRADLPRVLNSHVYIQIDMYVYIAISKVMLIF